jgi:hypothetical protein
MTLRPSGRAASYAFLAGFLLHTVVAFLVWRTWGDMGRSNVLTWIDFPVSLAFLHLDDDPFLTASLIAGGFQWAVIAALLTLFLGRTVRRGA